MLTLLLVNPGVSSEEQEQIMLDLENNLTAEQLLQVAADLEAAELEEEEEKMHNEGIEGAEDLELWEAQAIETGRIPYARYSLEDQRDSIYLMWCEVSREVAKLFAAKMLTTYPECPWVNSQVRGIQKRIDQAKGGENVRIIGEVGK